MPSRHSSPGEEGWVFKLQMGLGLDKDKTPMFSVALNPMTCYLKKKLIDIDGEGQVR